VVTASTLAALRRVEDLPELVLALGHEAAWEELPLPGWLDLPGNGPVARAAIVGRAGEFVWFGTDAAEAGRAAATIARRLVARGRVGGVLALSPSTRRLAVAVAFGDAPTIDCSLDEPDRLVLTRFTRLASAAPGGALAFASRAADALGAEAVGRRFFRRFQSTLESMSAALPRGCPAPERHGLALLQLTRVLFLYFVQSKGWLDGRADFLSCQVDRCLSRGRRLQRDLLQPLFFGTLNRPVAERSRIPRGFGRIPFLNGGLFEPHPLERRWRADLPNNTWRDAFDSLFERFDFTADEAGRPGVVAPDMLGRVFEGVMEPGLRHRSGTFYTPATLVRSVVHAGLVAVVAERMDCPESRAAHYLAERAEPVRRILREVTVLDPAVGSGAFLLGALELLSEVESDRSSVTAARRRVLRRSLFGVDLNAAAVRLTELRLWLAVIADEPAGADAVEPLPNLDCVVRQGDSLLDPAGRWPGGRALPKRESVALTRLRRELMTATGAKKRALTRDLRRAEGQAFSGSLEAAEAALDAQIAEQLDEARTPTLFGEQRGLDRQIRTELERLRADRHAVRRARRDFRREGELPWFHYESHFADVFARAGFDLVAGNPPWVRAEDLPLQLREALGARFRWWRAGGSRGFTHRPDLALAFIERAWELTRPGGAIALLVPAKLATAGYGARARHALAAQGTIRAVADLTGAPEAAFDATVYPLGLVVTKRPPPDNQTARTVLRVPKSPAVAGVPQRELAGGVAWVLAQAPALAALRALAHHPRFDQRFVCHLGVKTGANDLFIDPPAGVEAELLRSAIRGRDVQAFRVTPRRRLLWPCDAAGRPLPELPPGAAAHLEPHVGRLRARSDAEQDGAPWALFRTAAASAPYRVVWADLARRLSAAALADDDARTQIPLNSCYVLAVPDPATAERVAAWLNATWLRAAARLVATPAAGGFARFNARVVGGLPLPDTALTDPALDGLCRAAAEGCAVQPELDAIAARHLALEPDVARALAQADQRDDRR
jgi:hypothetical protein